MRVPVAAVAIAVVAGTALAGCSLTATPERAPDHLTASTVEDLLDGCENIRDGYPGAVKYTGEGPHTIAIFAKSLVSDASLTGTGDQPHYELENSNASQGLMAEPESPRDVALLACGDALPGRTQLNVCEYESVISMGGGAVEVPLFSQYYTFKVYELRTGRLVDTLQLETRGSELAPGCPGLLEGGTKVFAKAQAAELDALFTDVVTSPA